MRFASVMAIATLSRVAEMASTEGPGACESDGTVRFEFQKSMLLNFTSYETKESYHSLQFILPGMLKMDDYCRWFSRSPAKSVAPEISEIFDKEFALKICKLRDDLPKYFCQPFLEGDELRLMADLFSDRLDKVIDEIRANAELARVGAPVSSLVRIASSLALPPFYNDDNVSTWYYPQELAPIIHTMRGYKEGRRQWRKALQRARDCRLKYEGPIPEVVRKPTAAVAQPWHDSSERLPVDAWLYILCMTGPYLWHVRLVCKRWRSDSRPHVMVGVLGYGGAFKVLSGRLEYYEIGLRLDFFAQIALEEFCSASVSAKSGELEAASIPKKWSGVVAGLREIILASDPYRILVWYRDSRPKFPGLDRMIEADVFALFLGARDDVFVSGILEHILSCCTLGPRDPGWRDDNRDIGYRLVRAYLEKYPRATGAHPLPIDDSLEAWRSLQEL